MQPQLVSVVDIPPGRPFPGLHRICFITGGKEIPAGNLPRREGFWKFCENEVLSARADAVHPGVKPAEGQHLSAQSRAQ